MKALAAGAGQTLIIGYALLHWPCGLGKCLHDAISSATSLPLSVRVCLLKSSENDKSCIIGMFYWAICMNEFVFSSGIQLRRQGSGGIYLKQPDEL
jgi:hypothetical protein